LIRTLIKKTVLTGKSWSTIVYTRAFTSFNPQAIRTLSTLIILLLVLMSLSSLKQIDVEFMRRLHDKVNLIPIIAKSDTMTDEEVAEFKARVCHAQSIVSHVQL
jgi:hypothetical protein